MEEENDKAKPSYQTLTRSKPSTDLGPEFINLADKLDEKEQKRLCDAVIRDFDAAIASRERRMQRLEEGRRLRMCDPEQKNWPFKKCSNVCLPLLATASIQAESRLWDMMWPDSGDIFFAKPSRDSDVARFRATQRFFNWFVRYEMPDEGLSLYDTICHMTEDGSGFRHTFFDDRERRICDENVDIENMVVPHSCRVLDPSMRGVPCYTLVDRPSTADVKADGEAGYYINTDELKPIGDKARESQSQYGERVEKEDGTEPSEDGTDDDKPRQILIQYRSWTLPKKKTVPGFDGKRHYVKVFVDNAERKLLRIVLREEDDPRDVRRFQKETMQRQQFVDALQAYAAQPVLDPMMAAAKAAEVADAMTQIPAEPEPVRKREICEFTHFRGLPSRGFYGAGYIDLVGQLNVGANTLFNQMLDAMTLQNAGGGLISDQLRMSGDISVEPGVYQKVSITPALMQTGIYHHRWPGPAPSGWQALDLVRQMVSQSAANAETLSGEMPGANESATGAATRVEQAMKQITVMTRTTKEAMIHLAMKIWRLLSVTLDEDQAYDVINEDGTFEPLRLRREDFIPDAHLVPAASVNEIGQAHREARAEKLFAGVMQNPLTGQNPQAISEVSQRLMRAYGAPEMQKLFQVPPPPPPPPPKHQTEENAGFLQGIDSPVREEDDDLMHLEDLGTFLGNPMIKSALTPDQLKMAEQHGRNHIAANYLKTRRAENARNAGGVPPSIGGPAEGVAGGEAGPGLPALA
jgi:hypothetical protein